MKGHSNQNLQNAQDARKDEFYTTYADIEEELAHYTSFFKDQTVLCNCDDPFESNFPKYFLRNFHRLGLKRLICTSYRTRVIPLTVFNWREDIEEKTAWLLDIDNVPRADGKTVSDDDIAALLKANVKELSGSGDFRSEECIEYLKQADIVCTNPPFSLFRVFVKLLMRYRKKFLIIGHLNAITYKDIFPHIMHDEIWLGYSIHSGDKKFWVPDEYPLKGTGCGIENGRKYIQIAGARWFTNLGKPHKQGELIMTKHYYGNEKDYPKYDNYDAINIDTVADIPCDYFEVMGVPVSYFDSHDPSAVDIVGNEYSLNLSKQRGYIKGKRQYSRVFIKRRSNGIMGVPVSFIDKYDPDKFENIGKAECGAVHEHDLFCPMINNEKMFKRLLIKRKTWQDKDES